MTSIYQKRPKTSSGLAIIFLCLAIRSGGGSGALAETMLDNGALSESDRPHYLNLFVMPDFTNISKSGISVSGAGIGGGAQFGLNSLFGIGAQIRQSFDVSALSPLYTAIDLYGVYAITGVIVPMDRSIISNEKSVVSLHEYDDGGIRFKFYLTRYFFNATAAYASFTGVGGSLGYQLPTLQDYNYFFGVRADVIGNSIVTLVPLQVFAGLNFQLM